MMANVTIVIKSEVLYACLIALFTFWPWPILKVKGQLSSFYMHFGTVAYNRTIITLVDL